MRGHTVGTVKLRLEGGNTDNRGRESKREEEREERGRGGEGEGGRREGGKRERVGIHTSIFPKQILRHDKRVCFG